MPPNGGTAWTNRRILLLLALGTLIVSVIWHAPEEMEYISARGSELFLTFVLAMTFTYLVRPVVNALGARGFLVTARAGRVGATVVVFVAGLALTYLICAFIASSIRSDVSFLHNWFAAQNPHDLAAHWKQTLQAVIEPYQKSGTLPPDFLNNVTASIPNGVSLWEQAKNWATHSFSQSSRTSASLSN